MLSVRYTSIATAYRYMQLFAEAVAESAESKFVCWRFEPYLPPGVTSELADSKKVLLFVSDEVTMAELFVKSPKGKI